MTLQKIGAILKYKLNNYFSMNKNDFLEKPQGQTAIEYLLIIGAAILVVTIVIIFVSGAIESGTRTGGESTYVYLCDTLDSNTADCACYNQNDKNYFDPAILTGEGSAREYCCNEQKNSFLRQRFEC
jgi:uncharacterized protein (UPF0333 family)